MGMEHGAEGIGHRAWRIGYSSWQLATGSRQQNGMMEYWNNGVLGKDNLRGELFSL